MDGFNIYIYINDVPHSTELMAPANINSSDHELRSTTINVADNGGVKTFKGTSFSDVESASLFTNVQTKSSNSVQGLQHRQQGQQGQHQGQPISSKSDGSVARSSMQAPVLNPPLRNGIFFCRTE